MKEEFEKEGRVFGKQAGEYCPIHDGNLYEKQMADGGTLPRVFIALSTKSLHYRVFVRVKLKTFRINLFAEGNFVTKLSFGRQYYLHFFHRY